MTDYTLTTGADNFPGTPAADTFSGPAGGTDTLNGATQRHLHHSWRAAWSRSRPIGKH